MDKQILTDSKLIKAILYIEECHDKLLSTPNVRTMPFRDYILEVIEKRRDLTA